MTRDISLSYQDGSTLFGADAILQQYEIALFTGQNEFGPNPSFGIGLEWFLAEPTSEDTMKAIKTLIVSKTKEMFPEISIEKLQIIKQDTNQISIEISVLIVPYGERRTIKRDV